MRPLLLLVCLAFGLPVAAQVSFTPKPPADDPLAPLAFLLGTWGAAASASAGSAGATAMGSYTFHRDLAGHAIERTTSLDTCKGPSSFDCSHHDLLTVFADPNGAAMHGARLFALYLDSEGHVIYYTITTPDAHTAIFDSQGLPTLPKFRLTYHLEGDGPKAVMNGKFQSAAPGSTEYHSYLEWSGTRQ